MKAKDQAEMQNKDERGKKMGKTKDYQDNRNLTTELKYPWDEKYFLVHIGGQKSKTVNVVMQPHCVKHKQLSSDAK